MMVRDLTNDACQEYDVPRLSQFLALQVKALAPADLGKRSSLEFLVRWPDFEETWIP